MAAPRIYNSSFPSVSLPSVSLFSCLFSGNFDPSRPCFVDGLTQRVLTRKDIRDGALRFAHGAHTQLGLNRGEVAMVFCPNSIAWPIVLLGIVALGAKATLANASYTSSELAHQYKDSGARLLFVHPALLPVAKAMFSEMGISESEAKRRLIIMELGAHEKSGILGLEDLLNKGAVSKEVAFDGEAVNETVVLCYSSGTTGKPKGVETTHRNLTSELLIVNAISDYVPEDVFIAVLPFFHIYGLSLLALNPILLGAKVVVLPQFVPDIFFGTIALHKVSKALIVPPIALAFVHHPAATKHDLRSLRTIISGAAALNGELLNALNKRLRSLGATDAVVTQGYGMTELSPVSHFVTAEQARRGKAVTIGQLLPGLQARLVASDEETAVDAASGKPGEIWVRGPIVMKRYLNNEAATRATLTPDGWLKTGDIAIVDEEGLFTIIDRKKELIKYKGFQVAPAELEDVLLGHPEVLDAAVIGVADRMSGSEYPRAYVVRKPGGKQTEAEFADEVKSFVAGRMAKHKQLRGGVVVIDAIPKSASGKILRRELRARAAKELEATAVIQAKL